MRTVKRYGLYLLCFGFLLLGTGLVLDRLFPLNLKFYDNLSPEVRLENNELVHVFLTNDDKWRLKTSIDDVHPLMIDLLIAKEDRFFWSHWGVNPLALLRAITQYVTHNKIISGGSTLTMQVARLLEPRPRTIGNKMVEILRAIQLECHFSKQQILEMYLTLAPFGGNLEGVRAASLSYFGKSPAHLIPSDVALLVILPQSPKRWERNHFNSSVLSIRNKALQFAFEKKLIDKAHYTIAIREPLPQSRIPLPRKAHHLARRLTSSPEAPLISYCTLDIDQHEQLQTLAQAWLRTLPNGANLAILVAHHPSSKVIAYVGSGDFFNVERKGQIDYIKAFRSPGSTLKPFIYGLGFDLGLIHPESYVMNDQMRFGSYYPHNFDKSLSGALPVKKALQQSLNIPVVFLLNQIGTQRFLGLLEEAGIQPLLPEKEKSPGLSISLGGMGMSLEQLVTLYSALAQQGKVKELVYIDHLNSQERNQILSEQAASHLWSILSYSPHSSIYANQEPIAIKTGTSYGHRDALALGYNSQYVVGVWIGHAEGTPLLQITGASHSIPILQAIFKSLPKPPFRPTHSSPNPLLTTLKKDLFTYNLIRAQNNHFQKPQIIFPVNDTVIEKPLVETSPILLKVSHGKPPYTWLINNKTLAVKTHHLQVPWFPESPGFYDITVMDKNGAFARVHIEVSE